MIGQIQAAWELGCEPRTRVRVPTLLLTCQSLQPLFAAAPSVSGLCRALGTRGSSTWSLVSGSSQLEDGASAQYNLISLAFTSTCVLCTLRGLGPLSGELLLILQNPAQGPDGGAGARDGEAWCGGGPEAVDYVGANVVPEFTLGRILMPLPEGNQGSGHGQRAPQNRGGLERPLTRAEEVAATLGLSHCGRQSQCVPSWGYHLHAPHPSSSKRMWRVLGSQPGQLWTGKGVGTEASPFLVPALHWLQWGGTASPASDTGRSLGNLQGAPRTPPEVELAFGPSADSGIEILGAQRWRSENFERPVDLEGSGDDDSFPDDELDDLYSGSGSGYFEQESGIETAMRFSPDVAMAVSTTPAVPPTMDIQPVGTPFEELPSEHPTPEPATSPPVVTEVPEEPSQRATTVSMPTATTAATTAGALTVATVPATVATAAPSIPAAPPSTAITSVIRTTGAQRLLPLPLTTAATARATTPAAPSPPTTVAVLDTEAPTPRLVSTATSRPRALPRPATTQEPDSPEKSTLPLGTTAPGPTEVAQTPTPESVLTTIRDEPEVPVSGGPSGDFELPEEETTQPDTANEVVAVGGAAAKPSPPPGTLPKGAGPGPSLLDNAIDPGSSAAQLPQKSILERKEVLVAVIVGGVVGALFAAFLVTLLIYRMKKKDEGSYTLEEPKQASVTYQKPDKQEEFYA
ncbi:syndecan-3 [Lynx rufus]|nr:syndecan-3 [Lynx rufus]